MLHSPHPPTRRQPNAKRSFSISAPIWYASRSEISFADGMVVAAEQAPASFDRVVSITHVRGN